MRNLGVKVVYKIDYSYTMGRIVRFKYENLFYDLSDRKMKKILEHLLDEGKVFVRWSNSIEEISQPSFEIYDNVILDTVNVQELAFGLKKAGLLPDDVEEGDEYDWEEYAEELLEKARTEDNDARRDILRVYINNKEFPYRVAERIIDGKKEIGLEANGVNVVSGLSFGVPAGLRFSAYLSGEIKGTNIQDDGLILKINKIIAIYDNKLDKFIK